MEHNNQEQSVMSSIYVVLKTILRVLFKTIKIIFIPFVFIFGGSVAK